MTVSRPGVPFLPALLLTWITLSTSPGPLPAYGTDAVDAATIEGSWTVRHSGRLHILLVDQATFPVPMTGLQEVVLDLEVTKGTTLRGTYTFTVPAGTYGIRAYLDRNDNGTLDKGPFGPAEPWAMSWQGRPPFGFPRFGDIAFPVAATTHVPALELK